MVEKQLVSNMDKKERVWEPVQKARVQMYVGRANGYQQPQKSDRLTELVRGSDKWRLVQ